MVPTVQDYTIGWISALTDEFAAAEGMLDEEHPILDDVVNDPNSYSYGRIGRHNVVIACLPSGTVGTTAAATVAANMSRTFPNLRVGLLVGVGGGIPRPDGDANDDIRLGDVVVSTPQGTHGGVIQYDLGKTIQDGRFVNIGTMNKPPTSLSTAVATLRAKTRRKGSTFQHHLAKMLENYPNMRGVFESPGTTEDRLFAKDFKHIANEIDCSKCSLDALVHRKTRYDNSSPMVHYGLIGSANQVMRDAKTRDQLQKDKSFLCLEMEAGGLMNDFPCIVIRGICGKIRHACLLSLTGKDYCDSHKNKIWQPYAAAVAAAYAKELLGFVTPAQLIQEPRACEIMSELQIQTAMIRDVQAKSEAMSQIIDLSLLPGVEGAAHNWYSTDSQDICYPGTRTDVLQDIRDWYWKADSELIYWLNGMAGTGKTTIARTIAQQFAGSGDLAASFFFKRNEGDRGHAGAFFTTIARQLALHIPAMRPLLTDAIKEIPDIGRMTMKIQFEKLVLLPFSKIGLKRPCLIVIDALDECANEDDIKCMLLLMAELRASACSGIKVLVTGRPELYLRLGFERIKSAHLTFKLHDVPEARLVHDIGIFIRTRIADIRDEYNLLMPVDLHLRSAWPGEDNLNTLVNMAVPLFISATTICRFVGDSNPHDPENRLKKILKVRSTKGMARMYTLILEQLFENCDEAEKIDQIEDFRDVIGPIVTVFQPLSAASLAQLLDKKLQRIVDILHSLHSILKVPSDSKAPIHLFHLSFRDFLVDTTPVAGEFWICEADMHTSMANQCLRLLMDTDYLKQDICELGELGYCKPRSLISETSIQERLPSSIQYACLYWPQHFVLTSPKTEDLESVLLFLEARFLYWVEALLLLGRVSEISTSLHNLLNFISPLEMNPVARSRLTKFLSDAHRLMLFIGAIALDYPMLIYSSALIFAPNISVTKELFRACIPRHLGMIPEVQGDWAPELVTLHGHTHAITCMKFSYNNKHLVSGSEDGRVKVWDTITGLCITTIKTRNGPIKSVDISADGKRLISTSELWTIDVWDRTSGACLKTLNCEPSPVTAVCFSHSGNKVACGLRHHWRPMVKSFEVSSNKDPFKIYGIRGMIRVMVFSQCDKYIATGSSKNLCIWHASGKQSGRLLESFNLKVVDLILVSGTTELVAMTDDAYEIIAIDSGISKKRILIHPIASQSLRLINLAAIHKTCQSGDINNIVVDLLRPAERERNRKYSEATCLLSISTNGKLATYDGDHMIKIWDNDSYLATLGSVSAVQFPIAQKFSADGTRLIIIYRGSIIQVWDCISSKLIHTLHSTIPVVTQNIVVSENGMTIVCQNQTQTAVECWFVEGSEVLRKTWPTTERTLMALAANGSRLILGNASTGDVEVIDFLPTRIVRNFLSPCPTNYQLCGLAISSDGSQLFLNKHAPFTKVRQAKVVMLTSQESSLIDLPMGDFFELAYHPSLFLVFGMNSGVPGNIMIFDTRPPIPGVKAVSHPLVSSHVLAHQASHKRVHWFSFDSSGEYIQTNLGCYKWQLPILSQPMTCRLLEVYPQAVVIREDWIEMVDGRKLLWLPHACRPRHPTDWRATGMKISIISQDGRAYFFNFDQVTPSA